MKILLSVIEDLSVINGTTIRAKKVIDVIKKQHHVEVVTRSSASPVELAKDLGVHPKAIKTVSPPTTKLWNLKTITPVLRGSTNLVYCVADLFGFITYFFLAKILGFKLLFEAHALAHEEHRSFSKIRGMLYYYLELFIGKTADGIIALSKPTYNFYKTLNRHVFLVPVFIDEKIFDRKKEKKPIGSHRTIGIVGPFNTVFNYSQLEFLYENLALFNPSLRFTIIGECPKIPHKQIEYKGHLETRHAYLDELCKLDALLVPVKHPTLGPKNKIFEAMACGVPVFATPEGIKGLDWAKPGENIIVSPAGDLVKLVNTSLFNKAINQISTAARDTVHKYYSASSCGQTLLEILERFS